MLPSPRIASRFIRWDQSLFGAAAIFIAGILSGDLDHFQIEYLLAFIIVFFSAAGSFAFNDFCDRKIDLKNSREDRPLVSEGVSEKIPLSIGMALLTIAAVLSLFLNTPSALLVLLSLPLFYLYSLGLKRFILFKNLLIAYSFSAVILLGSLVSDSFLEPLILYFALMAFILGMAVEITLDIPDLSGDYGEGVITIPVKFGRSRAAVIAVILYLAIIIMDPLPYFLKIDSRLYLDNLFLTLILIPVASYLLISRSLLADQSRDNVQRLKNMVMKVMQVGCGAYLIGVLI